MGTNITGIGNANAIGFKSRVTGGTYFPPKLKDALIGVWSAYGKSNNSTDRNIIKNKIKDRGGDFVISNAAFKLNSGFGKYEEDFTTWLRSNKIINFDDKSFKFNTNESWVLLYHKSNIGKDTPSFKVHIEIEQKVGDLYYNYVNSNGVWNTIIIKSEEFETPISYNTLYTGETSVNIGFTTSGLLKGSITQIPSFQGAFTTDGIDDMIISTKTISEMGITDKITVVSMIHQIGFRGIVSAPLTNYIRTGSAYVRNHVSDINKTGIYGYTCSDIKKSISSNSLVINNILGDKNDYIVNVAGDLSNGKFSVQGYIDSSDEIKELSRVAWYWTFIAKDTLTTDEINQVIAYYNLDRPGEIVKPDILYDVKRQDITNENHAEFNDELIDFSGNNYNLKLYNMLWDKQSGIGNYPISFKDYTYLPARATVEINKDNFVITANTSASNFLEINTKTKSLPTYKVKIEGTSTITNGKLGYRFNTVDGTLFYKEILKDGEYEIPEFPSTETATYSGWCITGGFNDSMNVKITLLAIDDITDAIVLNGIDNFGKVIDVPIWKDYTICALRKWLYTASVDNGIGVGSLVSKSKVGQDGAFIAEQSFLLNPNKTAGYNFGAGNSSLLNDKINEKSFAIQTKYTYGINRQTLSVGSGLDTNTLWFGTVRDNDTRFSYLALWNLMLFPYTMSNFILERQLKKYKLGSFYDKGMVIWRPEVTSNNSNYVFTPRIRMSDGTIKALVNGEYYNPTDANLVMDITVIGVNEVTDLTINKQSYKPIQYPTYWRVEIPFPTKSPQRISITIEEYVRYESIVQPYPVMFKLVDKDTNKEYTWGDKVKVGSTIKVNSVIYNYQTLWSIHGYLIGNDPKTYSYNEIINKDIVVTKPLSFSCKKKWLLSAAEPLFVYDPAIFTNNAIKTIGYLPDISGQNRHLKLYNFSYEGMSGKDGYPVVFGKNKTWTTLRAESDIVKYGVSSNKLTIYKCNSNSALLYSIVYNNGTTYPLTIPSFKLKVTGIREGRKILYRYISESNRNVTSDLVIVKNGTYDIPQSYQIEPDESTPNSLVGFIVDDNSDTTITLEVLPDYKDSLYFNGITNTASVLNLDHGGKCLVTKINYKFNQETICIYDQRKNTLEENIKKFALLATQQSDIAYGNGLEGNTYINNVLNNYVKSSELENVEHVATLVSSVVTDSNTNTPLFGRNVSNQHYAQFAMYRTILLPEVPNAADRAILNKWCGLPTGYLPKPEYYWDVTGKSNSDTATRNTIKNLGTAKPVASTSDEDAYSLENKNVAYEGMSGYNGYPVVFGANKTWETYATYNFTSTINDNKLHITKVLNSNGLIFSYVKRNDELLNIKEIPSFKIKVTGLEGESKLLYFYLSEENAANITILTLENGVHKIPKSLIPTNALPNSTWIGFKITSIQEGVSSFDCDITLEILPDYYGLCLDGITNYVECANIPAFTDYTYILMRQILSNNIPNSVTMHKGIVKAYAGAFTADYVINNEEAYINKFAFHSFGATNIIYRNKVANKIIWANTTSVNGIAVSRGSNTDDESITIAKFENNYRRMVFYKLMLWSKSINNTYHINMLRNLINNSGIIDLNDSIFDQTSNE